ncbi:MAG: hypothetical protein F6K22_22645 [Okeania sp. SIO2F4]|uniref:hypothetical protein n=1 Tax=Okeania sp. SIO2F4 TaxID=2607790 RepID=UPI0014294281|nr:hypothetical protein [Okeania sp. SIO2F4]NES05372.1 hypothetical protein [Okeania sp. SIO2F4]
MGRQAKLKAQRRLSKPQEKLNKKQNASYNLEQILEQTINTNKAGSILGLTREGLINAQREIFNLNHELKKQFQWEFETSHEIIDDYPCDLALKMTKLKANATANYVEVRNKHNQIELWGKPPGSTQKHLISTFPSQELEKVRNKQEVFNNYAHYICPYCWDNYPYISDKLDLLLQQVHLEFCAIN